MDVILNVPLWMLLSGVSTFMAVRDGVERESFPGLEKL